MFTGKLGFARQTQDNEHKMEQIAFFDQSFIDAFSPFGTFDGSGNFIPKTSFDDILSLTVGEYLELLDQAVAAVTAIDTSFFTTLLNEPLVSLELDAEDRAVLESFADGDFSSLTGPLDAARAEVIGISPETQLIDIESFGGGSIDADVE